MRAQRLSAASAKPAVKPVTLAKERLRVTSSKARSVVVKVKLTAAAKQALKAAGAKSSKVKQVPAQLVVTLAKSGASTKPVTKALLLKR